ncbi:hypothetical protein Bbelb_315910 [Branchiostoma belcheri]|nr:hypothetical protein Bbelb_315910 [Branchiostoma belcheri]
MKFVDDKAKQICRDRLRFYGSFSRGPIVMTTKEMWQQHEPKLFKTPKEAMKLETNGKHARTSEKWTDRAVGAPRQRGRGAAMCSRQQTTLPGPPRPPELLPCPVPGHQSRISKPNQPRSLVQKD